MGLNVLSLFDGLSCGRIALERAGIKVDKYYASEIDKYAIQVSKKNYPDIIRLGDVTKWETWGIDWASIDLLIAGSPCQGFSFAGKQLAFDDPRSKLFFVFVDIRNHINTERAKVGKPNVKFMLENVRMKKEHLDFITEMLGIEPVMINSSLVSVQNRVRYYWANFDFGLPEDKGLTSKDILKSGEFIAAIRGRYIKDGVRQDGKMLTTGLTKQYIEYRHDGKSNALTTVQKDNVVVYKKFDERREAELEEYRYLTPVECEHLQTVPDNYTDGGVDCRYQLFYSDNECNVGSNTCLENVNYQSVISLLRVGKLNSAINTILERLEQGQQLCPENLSIKAKNVQLKGAQKNNKLLKVCASSTTKLGSVNSLKNLQNVRCALILSEKGLADCVLHTTNHGEDGETLYKLTTTVNECTNHTGTKAVGTINTQTVDSFIELSLKKLSEDLCDKEKLYTTLILINLIIVKGIFSSVITTEITYAYIDSLNTLRGSLLEMELSSLKMGNITKISNSARYKMLGNGWTVDVIVHIFKGLK